MSEIKLSTRLNRLFVALNLWMCFEANFFNWTGWNDFACILNILFTCWNIVDSSDKLETVFGILKNLKWPRISNF